MLGSGKLASVRRNGAGANEPGAARPVPGHHARAGGRARALHAAALQQHGRGAAARCAGRPGRGRRSCHRSYRKAPSSCDHVLKVSDSVCRRSGIMSVIVVSWAEYSNSRIALAGWPSTYNLLYCGARRCAHAEYESPNAGPDCAGPPHHDHCCKACKPVLRLPSNIIIYQKPAGPRVCTSKEAALRGGLRERELLPRHHIPRHEVAPAAACAYTHERLSPSTERMLVQRFSRLLLPTALPDRWRHADLARSSSRLAKPCRRASIDTHITRTPHIALTGADLSTRSSCSAFLACAATRPRTSPILRVHPVTRLELDALPARCSAPRLEGLVCAAAVLLLPAAADRQTLGWSAAAPPGSPCPARLACPCRWSWPPRRLRAGQAAAPPAGSASSSPEGTGVVRATLAPALCRFPPSALSACAGPASCAGRQLLSQGDWGGCACGFAGLGADSSQPDSSVCWPPRPGVSRWAAATVPLPHPPGALCGRDPC